MALFLMAVHLAFVVAVLGYFFWRTRKERTLLGHTFLWWVALAAVFLSFLTFVDKLALYSLRDRILIGALGVAMGGVVAMWLRKSVGNVSR